MVTSAQLRAARSLLNWTVRDLAEKAGVHRNTITRAETEATGQGHAVAQMVRTLESAGVIFVEENGEGPGVRLRKVAKGPEKLSRALDDQIVEQERKVAGMPEPDGPSPEAGLAAMDKALAQNELVELKNKQARRKSSRQK
jgi:transcriptional regulator with XRE-family HTH domain